jgi:large subunit ribosomal protein LP1
MDHVDTHQLS